MRLRSLWLLLLSACLMGEFGNFGEACAGGAVRGAGLGFNGGLPRSGARLQGGALFPAIALCAPSGGYGAGLACRRCGPWVGSGGLCSSGGRLPAVAAAAHAGRGVLGVYTEQYLVALVCCARKNANMCAMGGHFPDGHGARHADGGDIAAAIRCRASLASWAGATETLDCRVNLCGGDGCSAGRPAGSPRSTSLLDSIKFRGHFAGRVGLAPLGAGRGSCRGFAAGCQPPAMSVRGFLREGCEGARW